MKEIRGAMEELIFDLNMAKLMSEAKLAKDWTKIAGSHIAENSKPVSLIRGTLTLGVYSSTWSNQLSLMRADLIKEIGRHLQEDMVKDIRFKLIERPPKEEEAKKAQRSRPKIDPKGRREILQALTKNIKDEALAEGLRRAILGEELDQPAQEREE